MAGELSLKTPLTGLVTLVPTNTATDKAITLPATTGTMVVQDATNTTTVTNLAYTGTLTGGTGIINIGSGQIYKDASGNVGIGTSSTAQKLHVDSATSLTTVRVESDLSGSSYFSGLEFIRSGVAGGSIMQSYRNTGTGGVGFVWSTTADNAAEVSGAYTQRMYLDSSGNLGLGVTPSAWSSGGNITTGTNKSISSSTDGINLGSNWYYNAGDKFAGTGYASFYQQTGGSHIWKTSTASGTAGNAISFTQAMTLDANGALLVGITSVDPIGSRTNGFNVRGSTVKGSIGTRSANGHEFGISATSGTQITWYTDNGSTYTSAGNISSNGSSTAYNTSSDYRLKENVAPMTGALQTVAALKPCTYTWKADGSDGQGFIAHELQAVVPDCVTGTKDAVDESGKPQYQGVDTSFLVATVVAALQELTARLEVLENK